MLLATKPGDERGAFRGAERVRTHSPNEATDETDLVAPAGPMDPPGCGRWGFTPSRAAVNAGVVGPISPRRAAGAGHPVIESGRKVPDPSVSPHWPPSGKQQRQRFECLALALALSTGQGGGAFTSNFMDVTGTVTSLSVSGGGAAVRELRRSPAWAPGLGVPFTVKVTVDGPGQRSC